MAGEASQAMLLAERTSKAMLEEPIPSNDSAAAAEWLSKQGAYGHLPTVALSGPTALFWYVASLLAEYKKL